MSKATRAILWHMFPPCTREEVASWAEKAEGLLGEGRDVLHYQHSDCPKSEKERHQFCPLGAQSWCKWRQDEARQNDPDYEPVYDAKASSRLPHVFFHALGEIFNKMADETLLSRCENGFTQNAVKHKQIMNFVLTYFPILERGFSWRAVDLFTKGEKQRTCFAAIGSKTSSSLF